MKKINTFHLLIILLGLVVGNVALRADNVQTKQQNTVVNFVTNDGPQNKTPDTGAIPYCQKTGNIRISASDQQQLPQPDDNWEKKVKKLQWLAILSIVTLILFGIGLFISIAVWIKATQYRKKIRGLPNEKQLARQIKKAIWLSIIPWLLLILLISIIAYSINHNGLHLLDTP
jgi:hypothetical protein